MKQINLTLAYGRTYNKKRLLYLKWLSGFNPTICIICSPKNRKYSSRLRKAKTFNSFYINQSFYE